MARRSLPRKFWNIEILFEDGSDSSVPLHRIVSVLVVHTYIHEVVQKNLGQQTRILALLRQPLPKVQP